ncbi:MAG: hypothetical protein AB8B63_02405 [Granulosicoccus sp.]
MNEENSREASLPETEKSGVQHGKTDSFSSSRKAARRQENGNVERTGTPVRTAKPEPPPVRVIIEGGRPDGDTS